MPSRRQEEEETPKYLKHASETLAKTPEKHLKTIVKHTLATYI
jgi:hypothetical protein